MLHLILPWEPWHVGRANGANMLGHQDHILFLMARNSDQNTMLPALRWGSLHSRLPLWGILHWKDRT